MGARAVKLPDGTEEKEYLFGLIRKTRPKFKYFWQKNAEMSYFSPKFYPHDYEGKNYDERKKHAYGDAKNTRQFYQDLIDKGVFPKGAKVKVKRIRHEDGFGLEFFIPHLRPLPGHTSLRYVFTDTPNSQDRQIAHKLEEGITRCKKEIEETAKRYDYAGGLNEDVGYRRNYGLDKSGEVRIHDVHILSGSLPSKFKLESGKTIGQFYGLHRERNLERRAVLPILLILVAAGLSLYGHETQGLIIKDLPNPTNLFFIPLAILFIVMIWVGYRLNK